MAKNKTGEKKTCMQKKISKVWKEHPDKPRKQRIAIALNVAR